MKRFEFEGLTGFDCGDVFGGTSQRRQRNCCSESECPESPRICGECIFDPLNIDTYRLWEEAGCPTGQRGGERVKVTATWTVELNTECPHCDEYIDLLDDPDFWDGRELSVAENGTENSKDQPVTCPKCGHEFVVDCEY